MSSFEIGSIHLVVSIFTLILILYSIGLMRAHRLKYQKFKTAKVGDSVSIKLKPGKKTEIANGKITRVGNDYVDVEFETGACGWDDCDKCEAGTRTIHRYYQNVKFN